MLYCAMAKTQYLESDDSNGYFQEEMQVRESVIVYFKDEPFSDREIEAIRAYEKRVFEFGLVEISTWTTEMDLYKSQYEMIMRFGCTVTDWEEIKDSMF
jgi:hypothetical protein